MQILKVVARKAVLVAGLAKVHGPLDIFRGRR
jgi:hypothetical protein